MSKRGDPHRGGASPRINPANAQNMLQSLQQQMLEAQESLANETVQASAGGGAVSVVVSGQQKVQSIKISPEVIGAGDVEMLQDLIIAAVNEALEKSQQIASQKMGSLTGGLGLPGLLG
jgi:nucleoid-associated protein EbfC